MLSQRRERLLALILALGISAVSAQSTQSYNAQNTFNVVGTLTNRSGTLMPLRFNLYGIPVSSEYGSPDILLTLNATTGNTGLGIYCNPYYGAYADPSSSFPGPGYAVWYSDLATTVNQIFISKNDAYYSASSANSSTSPAFRCTVINNDANNTVNYTLVANIISDNRTLVQSEQDVLNSLYSRCCSATGACAPWKSENNGYVNANGGTVDTDFCSFPNQICSPTGNLYRLNLGNFNLSCAWPGDLLGQFSQLATLSLSDNPRLTGNTSAVFATIANLTELHFLDLSGDYGINGTIDSGTGGTQLCMSAMSNLVSLNLNSMGLTGNIPACLYGSGSSIISLDLGSNNFTGTLKNTIPANSSLQLLHVDYNKLTGSLPSSLANAQHLVDLDTTQNMLTGSIPGGIGAIPTLENFVVKMNNLSGPIPDSFGTALNLQQFDVKQNKLTALPAAWTNASYNAINSSYANIRASFNNISSPFPAGLVNAQQLTYLILNENQITGTLPNNSTMFISLRALNISYNRITGTIPEAFNSSAIFSPTPVYLSTGAILQNVFDLTSNQLNGSLPLFLNQSLVPSWTQGGIALGGNNLTANCSDPGYQYLTSICSSQPPPPPPPQAIIVNPTGSPSPSPTPSTSKSAPAPVTTAGSTATQSGTSSKGTSGLSGGAIAGIVIGVLAGLVAAGLVAWLIVRRRRDPRMPPSMNSGTFNMPGFGDGEVGRKSSLTKNLTSFHSTRSGFSRFEDEQQTSVELSPSPPK